jgi:hypothetical protein
LKFKLNLTVVLATIALSLAVIEWIHPFGGRPRISPGIVIVILLLVGVRYAARQQAQKREEIVKDVPARPLGLSDGLGENPSAYDGGRSGPDQRKD